MRDTTLRLDLVVNPGAEALATCEDAQRISTTLNADVSFVFNGVKGCAIPGGDSTALCQRLLTPGRYGYYVTSSPLATLRPANTTDDGAA